MRYISHRKGFEPLVVGLVKGLGIRFKSEVAVEHTVRRADGVADYDEFQVRFRPLAA